MIFWFIALLVRIIIAPLWHHGDADSFFYWAKYLWEKKDFLFFIGKSVPNAVVANYGPLFYLFYYYWRGFYELIGRGFWLINLKLPAFPSSFIWWYQSTQAGIAFNKLPAILADFGIAFLIYKISCFAGAQKRPALLAAFLFLFLPAGWYVSAYWGQAESLYSVFLLLGFYLALKGKFLISALAIFASAMIKPVGLFALPVWLVYAFKKKKLSDLLAGGIVALTTGFILYFPFWPENTLVRSAEFYFNSFKGPFNCLTANAFNLWALFYGFTLKSSGTLLLGFPANSWGLVFFTLFILGLNFSLWRKATPQRLILAAMLAGFGGFLFLTGMHERYFYPAMVFLAILSGLKKSWRHWFVLLSFLHWLNLYHLWWYPKVSILVFALSNLEAVRAIILVNIAGFIYFFRDFYES